MDQRNPQLLEVQKVTKRVGPQELYDLSLRRNTELLSIDRLGKPGVTNTLRASHLNPA